ncbi:hypothetical protein FGL91_13505 [Microbacterium sp. CBA3102]|uniref:hypothetical protein n=1 Tax=Microbacterium sp. CBA3102 TaxID=2603598 RepID=UPI0011BAEC0D|nr:hypothetical protein [Microbacterium sp. CBA3102]QEA29484.1 hypothetical protein FGL91_13505 [Microbacterium sp. CBA3102]
MATIWTNVFVRASGVFAVVARSTVGDLVTLQRGRTYKGNLVGEPGPALLGLGSIVPGGGFRGDFKTYGGECPPDLMLMPGDLFVSLKGATKDGEMIGSIARLPGTVASGRLTQDTVKLVFRAPDGETARYLYWLLRTPDYRAYCAGRAMGSAVVALSRDDFLSYPVPSLTSARKHIVGLLEDVEDKLESNRQLVEVLPQIIRASVDKAVNIDQRVVAVLELGAFVNGGAYTKGASGTGRMVLRIADLNSGPGPSTVYNDIEVPEDKTAHAGDILMSWSGTLGVYRWFRDEAIVNQHIFKVIPARFPDWLVFDRLDAVMPVFRGVAKDKATTMGHIQRGHLESTTVAIPTDAAMAALDIQMSMLWERLLFAERENVKLLDLRDALLRQLGSEEAVA